MSSAGLVADGFDVVAVGIEDEAAVVVGVVDGSHAGWAVVGPDRLEGRGNGEPDVIERDQTGKRGSSLIDAKSSSVWAGASRRGRCSTA